MNKFYTAYLAGFLITGFSLFAYLPGIVLAQNTKEQNHYQGTISGDFSALGGGKTLFMIGDIDLAGVDVTSSVWDSSNKNITIKSHGKTIVIATPKRTLIEGKIIPDGRLYNALVIILNSLNSHLPK